MSSVEANVSGREDIAGLASPCSLLSLRVAVIEATAGLGAAVAVRETVRGVFSAASSVLCLLLGETGDAALSLASGLSAIAGKSANEITWLL